MHKETGTRKKYSLAKRFALMVVNSFSFLPVLHKLGNTKLENNSHGNLSLGDQQQTDLLWNF